MGILEALQNYYAKKKTRRNSYPFTSRQTLEFNFFKETTFGYISLFMPPVRPPIQMTRRMSQFE